MAEGDLTARIAPSVGALPATAWDALAGSANPFVSHAFLTALVVIRAFVTYVSRFGFAPFAYYRIAIGGAALVWLLMR
ncbi:MAG: hypothetical protein B7Z08_07865 [Sphingomonadales bacterium 32-68-7]|nr:MAG: hypothetical protein B7Z08_07865 [Sphingomonadales bacterium 32-68-7]